MLASILQLFCLVSKFLTKSIKKMFYMEYHRVLSWLLYISVFSHAETVIRSVAIVLDQISTCELEFSL